MKKVHHIKKGPPSWHEPNLTSGIVACSKRSFAQDDPHGVLLQGAHPHPLQTHGPWGN